MFKKYLKNQKGLTLIELLAVVVILGIIAAIAVPAIGNVIEKTRLDAVKADAMQVLDASKLKVASEGVPTIATGETNAIIESTELDGYIEPVNTLDTYEVKVNPAGTEYSIKFTTEEVSGKTYTTGEAYVTDTELQDKDFFKNREQE